MDANENEGAAKSNLLVVGFGNCGMNAIRAAVRRYDPDENPYLSFLGVESNRKVRNSCFSSSGNSGEGYLGKWLALTERFKSIQLGASGLGAGGDMEVGEKMARERLQEFNEYFSQFDNVVLIAGGGGGTCGAMPVIAEALRDLGISTYAILTKPQYLDGPLKVEKAGIIERRMLDICPTTVIHNENMPNRKVSYKKVWYDINEKSLFWILWLLKSLLQEMGDVIDLDGSDWKTGIGKGRYTLPGFFDAGTEKGLEGFEEGLLGNPYLKAEIIKKALFIVFWFEGVWSVEDHNRIVSFVQSRIGPMDSQSEFKWGIREEGVGEGVKTVGFVAFAKEGPERFNDERVQPTVSVSLPIEISAPTPAAILPPPLPEDSNSTDDYVPFSGVVNGNRFSSPKPVPQALAQEYQGLFAGKKILDLGARAAEVQRRLQAITGITFDVPRVDYKYNGTKG